MSRPACLLVHGFGGASFEMLPVAEALEARGFPVHLTTLPGHDTTVEEWSRTRWSDWLEHVSAEYLRLEALHGLVFAIGLSMGGSLCLALAQRHKPAGVVTIASPVYLYRFLPPEARDWRLPLTRLIKRIRPVWPLGPAKPESRAIAPWRGYEGRVAMEPLDSMLAGIREVRRGLGRITSPLLAIHAEGDRDVPFGNLWEITRRVNSPVRKAVVLTIQEQVTKHHLLTTHRETKDEVARLCAGFVTETAAPERSLS